jgi:hypothetical protein
MPEELKRVVRAIVVLNEADNIDDGQVLTGRFWRYSGDV